MSVAERLSQARKRQGMTYREVGDLVGISHTAVQKYETGAIQPNSAALLRFAKALKVPVGFLLRPSRVGDIHRIAYRKRASTSKRQDDQVIEEIRDVAERYAEIERILDLQRACFSWPKGLPAQVSGPEQAEAAADLLRAGWNLGTDPIDDLLATLESRGLWVTEVQGHDKFDACAFEVEAEEPRPVIAIRREGVPGDRQRFTTAHELGHHALDVPRAEDESEKHYLNRVEALCNRFAGAFLAPRESFACDVGASRQHLSVTELIGLKERYGMSIRAIVYRCYDLGIITERARTRSFIVFNKAWGPKSEPGIVTPERPRRFEMLVHRAFAEGIISASRASDLLGADIRAHEGQLTGA